MVDASYFFGKREANPEVDSRRKTAGAMSLHIRELMRKQVAESWRGETRDDSKNLVARKPTSKEVKMKTRVVKSNSLRERNFMVPGVGGGKDVFLSFDVMGFAPVAASDVASVEHFMVVRPGRFTWVEEVAELVTHPLEAKMDALALEGPKPEELEEKKEVVSPKPAKKGRGKTATKKD